MGRAQDGDFYASDDEISGELLGWSGLDDLWDESSGRPTTISSTMSCGT
jgi:hypothetical protein